MKIPKYFLVSVLATMMCLHSLNFSTNNQKNIYFLTKIFQVDSANSGSFSPENFPLYPNYKEKQNQYVI